MTFENPLQHCFVFFRKYFFDLDDNSKDVDQGVDALALAQQSEASLNNLLDLEDKEDELLLQWEEQKSAKKSTEKSQQKGADTNLDLLGQLEEKDADQKMLNDLMGSPIKGFIF